MTGRTGGRHVRLDVIRIGRPLKILQVATDTSGVRQVEIVIGVALRTLQAGMCAGEWKPNQVVVKCRRLPGRSGVASLTGLWQAECHVIGIRGALIVLQVTPHTCRGRSLKPSADVTVGARQSGVHASQREPGVFQVIETGAVPGVHVVVALFAGGREPGGNVSGRGGLLKVFGVTGVTLRRETLKLSGCRALVAGVAIQRRVSAEQGETVLVLLDLLQVDIPALDRVTLLAACAKLTAMNVCVAIGAARTDIRKHRLCVALGTRNFLMHSPQRILGLVMFEFGKRAYGLPAGGCMAILTRNV